MATAQRRLPSQKMEVAHERKDEEESDDETALANAFRRVRFREPASSSSRSAEQLENMREVPEPEVRFESISCILQLGDLIRKCFTFMNIERAELVGISGSDVAFLERALAGILPVRIKYLTVTVRLSPRIIASAFRTKWTFVSQNVSKLRPQPSHISPRWSPTLGRTVSISIPFQNRWVIFQKNSQD